MKSLKEKIEEIKIFLEMRRMVTPKKKKKYKDWNDEVIELEKDKPGKAPVIDIKRDKPF